MSTDFPETAPAPVTAGIRMLQSPAEFTRCLGHPASYRNGAFALHLARVPLDVAQVALPVWRLGLVIPKRYEKSAVARNTIKRRWRAAFRQGQVGLSAEFGSADLVVRLQGPLLPRSTPADVALTLKPAKLRARAQFDPQAMLVALGERLRKGGAGRRAASGKPSRPARSAS